ncbi:hypothetical protein EAH_00029650 [Eimeria acervulina]|uniref:Uncharacterized protein n=1 Tax=Eimeria acervulina TaxID=5801 RepID=U6GFK7_EIMAC|nr:hypothetical protein EAH_00029650 [Eimeria acervulina]CDI78058.1 hypothetical protein EAH_00029650 [Eimeria acervulina]
MTQKAAAAPRGPHGLRGPPSRTSPSVGGSLCAAAASSMSPCSTATEVGAPLEGGPSGTLQGDSTLPRALLSLFTPGEGFISLRAPSPFNFSLQLPLGALLGAPWSRCSCSTAAAAAAAAAAASPCCTTEEQQDEGPPALSASKTAGVSPMFKGPPVGPGCPSSVPSWGPANGAGAPLEGGPPSKKAVGEGRPNLLSLLLPKSQGEEAGEGACLVVDKDGSWSFARDRRHLEGTLSHVALHCVGTAANMLLFAAIGNAEEAAAGWADF